MIGGLLPCSVGGTGDDCCAPLVRLVFPGDPMAVRQALERVMAELRALPIRPDDCGTVEIVLAEVLNNIVEHAYGGHDPGLIELALSHQDQAVCIELADNGAPMPGGAPPEGKAAVIGHQLEKLPEGGFGWFLIRSMADQLTYRREEGCNRLSFRLLLGGKTP